MKWNPLSCDKTCCGVDVAQCAKLALFAMATGGLGLALLLVVVEQWRSLPFGAKFGTAVILSLATNGAGYWMRFHRAQTQFGDWLFFFGALFYGAGAWLAVGQDPEPFMRPWAFFFWAAGALPLGLVLNSLPMLVLTHLVGTAWFVSQMSLSDGAAFTSLFLVVTLCSVRWAYSNRWPVLLTVALLTAVLWWGMLPVAASLGRQGWFWAVTAGPVLCLIGLRHDDSDPLGSVYKKLGAAVAVLGVLALAMPSVSQDLLASEHWLRYWLCGLALVGAAIAFVPAPWRFVWQRDWPALAALGAVALVPGLLGLIGSALDGQAALVAAIVLAAIYNAAAVAISAALVICGATQARAGCVALGVAYLVAWAVLITLDLAANLSHAAMILAVAAAALLVIARYWPRWIRTHENVPAETA